MGQQIREVVGGRHCCHQAHRGLLAAAEQPPCGRAIPPDVALELGENRCNCDAGGVHGHQRQRQPVADRGHGFSTAASPSEPCVEGEVIAAAADHEAPQQDGEHVVGGADQHRAAMEDRHPEHRRGCGGDPRAQADEQRRKCGKAKPVERPQGGCCRGCIK